MYLCIYDCFMKLTFNMFLTHLRLSALGLNNTCWGFIHINFFFLLQLLCFCFFFHFFLFQFNLFRFNFNRFNVILISFKNILFHLLLQSLFYYGLLLYFFCCCMVVMAYIEIIDNILLNRCMRMSRHTHMCFCMCDCVLVMLLLQDN